MPISIKNLYKFKILRAIYSLSGCNFLNFQRSVLQSSSPVSVLALSALQLLIQGCSFAPIGENKFDCNRKDSPNAYCRSIKALVRSTQGELPETRYEKEFDMHDYDRANSLDVKTAKESRSLGIAPGSRSNDNNLPRNPQLIPKLVTSAYPLGYPLGYPTGPLLSLEGAPVRVAPVIQRVYIKSYVDADDVLIQDQIIYKEIARSKWTGFETGLNKQDSSLNNGARAQPHRVQADSISSDSTISNESSTDRTNSYTPNTDFGAQGNLMGSPVRPSAGAKGRAFSNGSENALPPINNLTSNSSFASQSLKYASDEESRQERESDRETNISE